MKLILDVKDAKVPFVMELLKNFSFIKAKPISPYKAEVLENLNEAVTELNLVSEGKLKVRKAEDLFNEL
ncbi:MAG: hypothetical protein ACEQSR_06770 [Candidatus Methylacidiphilales bacterium]